MAIGYWLIKWVLGRIFFFVDKIYLRSTFVYDLNIKLCESLKRKANYFSENLGGKLRNDGSGNGAVLGRLNGAHSSKCRNFLVRI